MVRLDHRSSQPAPRVAIVHDWLPVYGGAERVLEQIIRVFPDADLFSLVDLIPDGERNFLQNKLVRTSFIQRWKWTRKRYRSFLPLMPLAIEQFDLSGYDLIISSSYAVAKGVITGPDQLHVCYCHSPMRYAWDLQHQYLRTTNMERGIKSWLARIVLHYMRLWDVQCQSRVDYFFANSRFVGRRIKKVYGRHASIVYPPVDVDAFTLCEEKDDYYLTVSRLVPYKMVGLIVDAFNQMPHLELRVIGDGPEFERIKARAGSNVRMLGHQSNSQVCAQMRRAKAFVFAAEEDFGIAPVEAQASGTPVIAYAKGGVCESVVPGETGLFFHEQTAMALRETVLEFEREKPSFSPSSIRENALRFSTDYFRRDFESKVMNLWRRFVGTAGVEEPEAAENPDAVRWPRPLPTSVAVSQA